MMKLKNMLNTEIIIYMNGQLEIWMLMIIITIFICYLIKN